MEFNASTPFAYFADYEGEIAAQLWKSRREEMADFEQYADPMAQSAILNPCSRDTVDRCILNLADRTRNAATLRLFTDLIRLRREDKVLDLRPPPRLDGATLTEHAFVLRWLTADGRDRLLLVNLGDQIRRPAIPEPLLAPPAGKTWQLAWSSNDPKYGGLGTMCRVGTPGWASGRGMQCVLHCRVAGRALVRCHRHLGIGACDRVYPWRSPSRALLVSLTCGLRAATDCPFV